MKKYQFLLLDAGPIIKLFELDIWDDFLKRCAVTISRTVAAETKYASRELKDIRIDLEPYEQRGLIRVVDLDVSRLKAFYDRFDLEYKAVIDPGEHEILAFLCDSDERWLACSADCAVFRVLGLLGRADQGISLQEVLEDIGLSRSSLERQYTKSFREQWTQKGQADSIQDRGLS